MTQIEGFIPCGTLNVSPFSTWAILLPAAKAAFIIHHWTYLKFLPIHHMSALAVPWTSHLTSLWCILPFTELTCPWISVHGMSAPSIDIAEQKLRAAEIAQQLFLLPFGTVQPYLSFDNWKTIICCLFVSKTGIEAFDWHEFCLTLYLFKIPSCLPSAKNNSCWHQPFWLYVQMNPNISPKHTDLSRYSACRVL